MTQLSAAFDTRREAIAFLPGFLTERLPQIEFEPIPADPIPF